MECRSDSPNSLGFFDYRDSFSIGTLGPVGTSSEQAALFLSEKIVKIGGEVFKVNLYDSFEDVLEALSRNEIKLAVVPNAYERVNEYYINPETVLVDLFIHSTPSYGLVKRPNEDIPAVGCSIVTHPAPRKLVDLLLSRVKSPPQNFKVSLVKSTSVAANMVKSGEADLAITNEIAARKNGLEIIEMYGAIKMSWSVFAKNNEVML